MSSRQQALATLIGPVLLSFDGATLGVVLACVAVRSFIKYISTTKTLRVILRAPESSVSDLRSILDHEQNEQSPRVVIVRGHVETKSAVDGKFMNLKPRTLVSRESGDKAVIIQRNQTCLYNEWRGLFGWYNIWTIFDGSGREKVSTSIRTVPFILVDGDQWPQSEYVIVDMEGSRHTLPLVTVYHKLQPIHASSYTFLHAILGHGYPVGVLDEEKILPLGKEITVVGICNSKNGIPEIKSCKDLPYFLSDKTKDQMVVDLGFKTKVLLWGGIVLGSVSIGILGYAIKRNWTRWKEWRQQRQSQQVSDGDSSQIESDEEVGDVPDGQLCVICLMRRRRSAFIPCGHLVCCQICVIAVERERSPKCPLCRQAVRSSMRIFDT
ncbi:hypothetical protein K2173_024761 [Erythroxylum novogranatense]|uniref:RING-type E3 ubiquitin transferase n=1 Tax=Erythroxylum novogranatense TaxID=1862640 RepID=A0AAV8SW13_9ROSI|nr:hypothetical protein K2173_024761 [Erythroxylum novogranatense]